MGSKLSALYADAASPQILSLAQISRGSTMLPYALQAFHILSLQQ